MVCCMVYSLYGTSSGKLLTTSPFLGPSGASCRDQPLAQRMFHFPRFRVLITYLKRAKLVVLLLLARFMGLGNHLYVEVSPYSSAEGVLQGYVVRGMMRRDNPKRPTQQLYTSPNYHRRPQICTTITRIPSAQILGTRILRV